MVGGAGMVQVELGKQNSVAKAWATEHGTWTYEFDRELECGNLALLSSENKPVTI